eukprot:5568159-Ditylum_brightwellii.AAC.1
MFQQDGAPQIQSQQPDYNQQIRQAYMGETIPINYKSVFNSHKMLLHYGAPAGTGQDQADVLTTKNEKYTCKVTKSSLT